MAKRTQRRSLPHVPALDGIRGVAVAAVLLHHADRLTGGWLGVDLFFALSGYLITALLLREYLQRDDRRVDLPRFWSRRIRRLGPALIITLVGIGIFAATVAAPVDRLDIRYDGLATLFEVANWRTILTGGDYWAGSGAPSPLRHTWSLAIEEQIYLLWPLALAGLLAWRGRVRAVLIVTLGGAAVSTALLIGLHAVGVSQPRLYYGTDTRATTLLLGAAVAAWRAHVGPRRWTDSGALRRGVAIGASVVLAVLWWGLDGASSLPYRGLLPVAGLAAACVVAGLADHRHPGPLGRLLALPPLVVLGQISYGLYLYHWPIYLWLTPARVGLDGWALDGLRMGLSVALAWVSYVLIEQPVRHGFPAGRPARAMVPGAAAIAVLALLIGTQDAALRPDLDSLEPQIFVSSIPDAPVLMVAGDSVPLLLAVEMIQQVDELEVSVAGAAGPGCHLLASEGAIRGVEGDVRTDTSDCTEDGELRSLTEEYQPDVAMLLFGEFPNEAVELDGRWSMPCEPLYLDAYRARVEGAIDDLQATGAPVVLVTAPGTSVSWILDRVEPGMPERVQCMNDLLIDVARDRAEVGLVDLATYVCPEPDQCNELVDGVDLRPDGLHFQGPSAAYINRWLIPQVLAVAANSD